METMADTNGFDEFDDDSFNRASRSAIRARACSNPAANTALRATRSSYDGSDDSADTTRQPTSVHNRRQGRPTTYPVTFDTAWMIAGRSRSPGEFGQIGSPSVPKVA